MEEGTSSVGGEFYGPHGTIIPEQLLGILITVSAHMGEVRSSSMNHDNWLKPGIHLFSWVLLQGIALYLREGLPYIDYLKHDWENAL